MPPSVLKLKQLIGFYVIVLFLVCQVCANCVLLQQYLCNQGIAICSAPKLLVKLKKKRNEDIKTFQFPQ